MKSLDELLQASAAYHRHLCPRQVLGVRMGLLAGHLLELDLPRQDRRLLTIIETDGCTADGITVATGCSVGKRTLRVEDYGKVAATFVDTKTGQAVRLVPHRNVRHLAFEYAPQARNRWEAHLVGYQVMPDEQLFRWQQVTLTISLQALVSHPGVRVACDICGEEILNEREIDLDGLTLCRACAGRRYYRLIGESSLLRNIKQRSAVNAAPTALIAVALDTR